VRHRYHVRAERDGRFWHFRVAEAPGIIGQALRLDQLDEVARDMIGLWFEVPEASFDIDVVVDRGPEVDRLVREIARSRAEAAAARRMAAETVRGAVRDLRAKGLTIRDVGQLLGVSHQRVAQLAKPQEDR
jgi:hypothetical protein